MNLFRKLLLLFAGFANIAHADLDTPEQENFILQEHCEPLIVSLGSFCEIAHMLKDSGMRKAAFPFDWICSFDGEKLIEILEDDFSHFTDENSLMVSPIGPGFLLNSEYLLEFLHEGDFRGEQYLANFQKLKTKYARRIERFRALNEYQGKVIFMRSAYYYSLTDPHRVYFCKANLEITDEYSLRLYNVLKRYFPKLDFKLIIVNHHDGDGIADERVITDHLIKIRRNNLHVEGYRYMTIQRYLSHFLKEIAR